MQSYIDSIKATVAEMLNTDSETTHKIVSNYVYAKDGSFYVLQGNGSTFCEIKDKMFIEKYAKKLPSIIVNHLSDILESYLSEPIKERQDHYVFIDGDKVWLNSPGCFIILDKRCCDFDNIIRDLAGFISAPYTQGLEDLIKAKYFN